MIPKKLSPITNYTLTLNGKPIKMVGFSEVSLPENASAYERQVYAITKIILTPCEWQIFRYAKKRRVRKKYTNLIYRRLEGIK